MSGSVKLTIDGIGVQAPEGTNLIDAAALAGVHIPNLCYIKGMKGIGACRLCLVEVEGSKGPVVACNTRVKEGMSVSTKSEKLFEARKFVIDLILSMHPLDCMTCTKAGVCSLQKYAYEFGIKESSFTRKKFGYPADVANPFIKRDPEYCILCARCVRVCREQGTNVLDFMGRGVGAKVATADDRPLQESGCTFCGSCVDACPVNALLEADRWRRGREWEHETLSSACLLCGGACDISVSTKDGAVQKITSGGNEGSASKYICAYGRFGFDCLSADTRLDAPLKRVDGRLKETTWEDALGIVAGKLKGKADKAGFVSTAGITNEDALALKRLAKEAVKTKNFDTTLTLYADAESFRLSGTADIDSSDVIVLVGLNPSQWTRSLPALDASVRRRVQRGAKLIVIDSTDTGISDAATVLLKGDEISSIKAVIKALISKGLKAEKGIDAAVAEAEAGEEAEAAAALISGSKETLILSRPSLFGASANLASIKGKIVSVPFESNARGVSLMGLSTEGRTYAEMARGEGIGVLYAVGDVPFEKRPDVEFLVVQNSHLTALSGEADVVLPSAHFLESAGTITDFMGRLKYLPRAVEAHGEAKGHGEIFIALSKIMGSPIKNATESEVKKAMKTKAKPATGSFDEKKGLETDPLGLIEAMNISVINGSRLLWLREVMKTAV